MRKLATVDEIVNIQPIPDADTIETYTVRSWQVVDRKGKYQIGDKVIYIEPDAFLPIEEQFEFLRKTSYKKMGDKEGFRLKIIRLRGQFSSGLIIPLDLDKFPNAQVGDDLTEALGIELYEAPISAQLAGQVKGNFPSFFHKTDQERIQNLTRKYPELIKAQYVATEKLEGTSLSTYLNMNDFGVCSRNLNLKESETNSYWNIVRKLDIETLLRKLGRNLALQGELIGSGIQANPYKLQNHELYIYNVFDIDTQLDLSFSEQYQLVVDVLKLNYVPIVEFDYSLPKDVAELIQFADGKSKLNPQTNREGLVLRDLNSQQTFKIISNNYLLKQKD